MFSNPFTPESQKAKKSLFKKEAKGFILSKEVSAVTEKIIADNDPNFLVKYDNYEIKRSQAEFLYALEKQMVKDWPSQVPIDLNHARNLLLKLFNKNEIIVSASGDIETLNLGVLNLKALPAQIGKLTHLQILYCHSNSLRSLPEQIGKLVSLKIINLANNELEALPKQIGNLHNLKELICTQNELNKLPEEISQLVNLQKLFCAYNNISVLPKHIGKLKHLVKLEFYLNKLSNAQKEEIKKLFPFAQV